MEILKFDALKKKKKTESKVKVKVTAGIQKPVVTPLGKAAALTCGSTGCCG